MGKDGDGECFFSLLCNNTIFVHEEHNQKKRHKHQRNHRDDLLIEKNLKESIGNER